MNPIDPMFARRKAERRAAFLPFLAAGDPDLAFTADALRTLAAVGADLVEVGFPFSDPVADGPVIQAAYTRALNNKLKLVDLFDTLRGVTSSPDWNTPLVGMASYSLIHKRGAAAFVAQAKAAGLSGAVLPDLPAEEAAEFAAVARDADFHPILLVTPTTSPRRAEQIVRLCRGFVYVVSVVGITGSRDRLPADLRAMLTRLRGMTDLPLCVGFGVSRPEQVRELSEIADGVIVGTALVKAMAGTDRAAALAALGELAGELAAAGSVAHDRRNT